jgi:hypothetical protein
MTAFRALDASLTDVSPTIFTTEACGRLTNEPVGSGIVVPEGTSRNRCGKPVPPLHIQACRPKKPATKMITTTTPMM